MPHQKNGMFIKIGLADSGALVSCPHFAVFITLLIFCRDQSQACQSQIKVATLGETVVLPCHLETPLDDTDLVVEWTRPDLSPGFVYMWKNNKEDMYHGFIQPSYMGRTSLFVHKLKHGDVSLKLSEVTLSDEGMYRCLVPTLGQESFVQLIVGSVSTPVIDVISENSGELVLHCESQGWYPEPEVLWLDDKGNLLSAGPTETVRGPDDLYTVSSRVTVDQRDGNKFTCRVQQNHINQTRQTKIYIHYFIVESFSVIQCLGLFIIALAVGLCTLIFVWKRKQN